MSNKLNVFISYRRNGGDVMAKYLHYLLTEHGYNVFYDFESLHSGQFGEYILRNIEECDDFIVVLSRGIFSKGYAEEDWVQREIGHAIKHKKNVIPVQLKGFEFPVGCELDDYSDTVKFLYGLNSVSATDIGKFVFQDLKRFLVGKPHATGNIYERNLSLITNSPSGLDDVNDEVKRSALKTILYSLVKENNAEMVYSMIQPYVNSDYNLRLKFDYAIDLAPEFDFYSFVDIDKGKYYGLKERLTYTKKFIASAAPEEFWIKFDTGLADLDDSLRNERVLFSEDFSVDAADLQKIVELPAEKRLEFIEKVFKVQLAVNSVKLRPTELVFATSGLHLKYSVPNADDLLTFKLSFVMPFNKNTRFFFAAISEPTYSPRVLFRFDSDFFDVKMVPFLSQNVLAKDAMALDGECEFNVDGEWVLPMSGAVFVIAPVDNVEV